MGALLHFGLSSNVRGKREVGLRGTFGEDADQDIPHGGKLLVGQDAVLENAFQRRPEDGAGPRCSRFTVSLKIFGEILNLPRFQQTIGGDSPDSSQGFQVHFFLHYRLRGGYAVS